MQDNNIDYSAIDNKFIKRNSMSQFANQLLLRVAKFVLIGSSVLLALGVMGLIVKPSLQRRLSKRNGNKSINEMNEIRN